MNDLSDDDLYNVIREGSSLTHAHEISVMACMMYTKLLKGAIKTKNSVFAYKEMVDTDYKKYFSEDTIKTYDKLLTSSFTLSASDIGETGYVVDSLKAAVYSLMMSSSYESTIKRCVKLGYDTDTNACIVGSLAGVIYGIENIPNNWLQKLKKRDYLEKLADEFKDFLEKNKDNERGTK